jgi:hypothetical protein
MSQSLIGLAREYFENIRSHINYAFHVAEAAGLKLRAVI